MRDATGQNSSTLSLHRREFLRTAAAFGGAAIVTPLGLRPAVAQEGSPRRGGNFRIALSDGATSDSLDPALSNTAFTRLLLKTFHGYLTHLDANGQLTGELAEDWNVTPDAKTWTFRLRRGVEFHDGRTLTPADVIASINYHRGANSKSVAKAIVDPIDEIFADGSEIVTFKLKGGNADFPYLLEAYQLPILPSTDGQVDLSGVGAGGYKLSSADFGVSCSGERFDNYWRSGAAWFDTFEALVISDPSARNNALISGQVDAVERCDLNTIHLLERVDGISISSVAGTQHNVFAMLCNSAPFDDPDVRLALKYGIDRQEILDKILRGYGQLGNDHPIASSNRYFASELPQREYDPDKARFHLKKAGHNDLSVSLSTSDTAFLGSVDAGLLYQQKAAASGINMDVVREANDGYWDTVYMKKPFFASQWSGRPTADWMFTQGYAADTPSNETFWSNDRFNKLLNAARAELDDSKRREMYFEMQGICSGDGGSIIPVFANYVGANSKAIGRGKVASNWDLDGYRCIEKWWFNEV